MHWEVVCTVRMGRGCSRPVMWFNSPRMRRGVRVQSRHATLHITAFTNRGGTGVKRLDEVMVLVLGRRKTERRTLHA